MPTTTPATNNPIPNIIIIPPFMLFSKYIRKLPAHYKNNWYFPEFFMLHRLRIHIRQYISDIRKQASTSKFSLIL